MAESQESPKSNPTLAASTGGVYYRQEDSPGVFSRALIALIDLGVDLGLMGGALAALPRLLSPGDPLIPFFIFSLAWIYLVALKYSGLGTIGYLVFGVEIVDLTDERPGLLRLTLRTLLAVYFNPIADLSFAYSETSRQCLRDKLTGTYVIKKSAPPAGHGEFVRATTFFLGMALVYREVKRKD